MPLLSLHEYRHDSYASSHARSGGFERAFVDAWERSTLEIGELPGCRSEQRDRLTAALRELRESAERKSVGG